MSTGTSVDLWNLNGYLAELNNQHTSHITVGVYLYSSLSAMEWHFRRWAVSKYLSLPSIHFSYRQSVLMVRSLPSRHSFYCFWLLPTLQPLNIWSMLPARTNVLVLYIAYTSLGVMSQIPTPTCLHENIESYTLPSPSFKVD